MPLPSRRFGFDEELGKRDDDHKYRPRSTLHSSWRSWVASPRVRRRRMLSGCLLILFVFCLFRIAFKSRAANDDDPFSRPSFTFSNLLPTGSRSLLSSRPPEKDEDSKACLHYYNGPIEYRNLGITLHAASRTRGHLTENSNVLFAAANLKSVATLMPLACEMARWRRNDVHFVLMGRDNALLEDILEINAVTSQCDIRWHDARPIYARYSSDDRMARSVSVGMRHIHTFVHPQVVLTDGTEQEDPVFLKALRTKSREIQVSLIELPQDALEKMMWITRLDSGSLKAWNKADVDILIRVPEGTSGGLIRLLKSLERADYPSSPAPRITIDLPPVIDPPTRSHLSEFAARQENRNRIILRHRIRPNDRSEDSSIRFLETLFPANPSDSHVLVLSPQVELASLFYHYLKYTLLEYKYASYGTENRHHLLGISLELPYKQPGTFASPQNSDSVNSTFFLWQEPNSKAALYFGDKWIEAHDFVRRRLETEESRNKSSIKRLLSKDQPYWMEYFLELAQLRGYHMLYPQLDHENTLVTTHNELSRALEGYAAETSSASPAQGRTSNSDSATNLGASSNSETSLTSQRSLLSLIPPDGDLPVLEDLAVLSHNGHRTSLSAKKATKAAIIFRRDIGGCGEMKPKKRKELSAADLFCSEDDEEEPEEEKSIDNELENMTTS